MKGDPVVGVLGIGMYKKVKDGQVQDKKTP